MSITHSEQGVAVTPHSLVQARPTSSSTKVSAVYNWKSDLTCSMCRQPSWKELSSRTTHGDHGGGALIAQKRWGIPVYANHRTSAELGLLEHHTHQFGKLSMSCNSEMGFRCFLSQSHTLERTMSPLLRVTVANVQRSSPIWVVGRMNWCIMSRDVSTSQSKQIMIVID